VFSNVASVTLVPELRGSASFGNTEGMMVVIDGFPIDEFPADYPMANVESVEVVKDPKELIKWGPKASAGIIMIKTKGGKQNKVMINYSSNFYLRKAAKFDPVKLQLASSADIVEHLIALADSNRIGGAAFPENTEFGERLAGEYARGRMSREDFIRAMDSLSYLSNADQVGSLQRDAFSHNHLLNVSGGSRQYRFALTSTFNQTRSNSLNDRSDTYGLDLKNNFNLLDGKLQMQWQLNGTYSDITSGKGELDVYNLPRPYQLLYDQNGNYIYDQSAIGPERNALIMGAGYFNHGSNVLEEARLYKHFTKNLLAQTRFDMTWNLFEGLDWVNAFYLRTNDVNMEQITDRRSAEARQLFNSYGTPLANGVDFHVPVGDIMRKNKTYSLMWNLRSGLRYNKKIGDHHIGLEIGGGGSSDVRQTPSTRSMYGYNYAAKTGLPIYVPNSLSGAVSGFGALYQTNSLASYPRTLLTPSTGDSTSQRSLNWNTGIRYDFKDKLFFADAKYNEAYSPNYGMGTYAKTAIVDGRAGYTLRSEKLPDWMSAIVFTTGFQHNQLPNLPTPLSGRRERQKDWDNYAIWVSNYLPVQQVGQSSSKYYQRATLSLFDKQLNISAAYNRMHLSGISESGSLTDSAAYGIKRSIGFVSAMADGSLRDGTLLFTLELDRSPEGTKQFNANLTYDIKQENYFTSEWISSMLIGGTVQNTSSFQGLGLMMGTNTMQGGGFGIPTNNTFTLVPPKNKSIEAFFQMGFNNERTRIDLRYYNRSDEGLSNSIPIPADPASGINNQITYSNIVNRGLEFYIRSELVKKPKFGYSVALNGAYNQNFAKEVPKLPFNTNDSYLTGYRSGYSTSNMWAYRWAGLNKTGAPQIYDQHGNATTAPDSTTLADALVYMGVSRAPWTGGFLQDVRVGNFFGRATLLINLGAVMKRYIPATGLAYNNSALISKRWKKPGDEAFTDVPALSLDGQGSVREFITRNSTNSYFSADFVRLQEVMVGWQAPSDLWNNRYFKSFSVAFHAQNLAFWTKNKYHLDPNTVDMQGRAGMPIPVQYGCTINASF